MSEATRSIVFDTRDGQVSVNMTAGLMAGIQSVQSGIGAIAKKGNANNRYTYARLDDILVKLTPLLVAADLTLVQLPVMVGPPEQNEPGVYTMLAHVDGGHIMSTVGSSGLEQKGMNDLQQDGATYSYLRRYVIGALFAIATEEDTDGRAPRRKAKAQQPQRQANALKYGDGSSVDPKPATVKVYNDYRNANGKAPASRAELEAWYVANKGG